MSRLPSVTDEPEDRKRIWGVVHEEIGVRLLHADRQFIWNAIAHELAEKIRAGKGAYYPTSDLGGDGWIADAAADLIDPKGSTP